jgi:hypothetical protein
VENVFLIFGGGGNSGHAASASTSGTRYSPPRRPLHPSLIGQRRPSPSAARITRTASPTQASTRWSLIPSSTTRGSPR